MWRQIDYTEIGALRDNRQAVVNSHKLKSS